MPNIQVLLGFDFGLKRIGVAVGQMLLKQARPLATLSADNGIPDWHVVAKLIKEWGATAFVVGIPINLDGTEQPVTSEAKKFADSLQIHFNLPVYEVDERFTTIAARQLIFEQGGFKQLKKEQIDSIAAKLILEQWMHSHK